MRTGGDAGQPLEVDEGVALVSPSWPTSKGKALPGAGDLPDGGLPATSRPRSMTTRWVQDCSTSARRWLETITSRVRWPRTGCHHLGHLADLGWVDAVGRLVQDEQIGQAQHGLGELASRCRMPWE